MIFIKQNAENEKQKIAEFKTPYFFPFRFMFLLSITSAIVLIFIAGCLPTKPEPVESLKAETQKLEVPTPEAPKPEPPKAETLKPEPATIEPPKSQTTTPEPPKAEPPKLEPPTPEAAKPEPAKPEPAKPEPPEPKTQPAASFHDKCADILKNYVSEKGLVDYKTLKRKRIELKNLLDEFDELDPNEYNSWPPEDKIAFWLNAYNIQMLNIIVQNYPIESSRFNRLWWPPTSIRHIKGIWRDYKFIIMDEEFTLSEIERRFLRKQFDEPRLFFAICNASLASPPLRNEPYYGHKLYDQLDDQIKKFLAGPQGFSIDRDSRIVYLSAILEPTWFGREFIGKYGTDKKFKDQTPEVRAVLNFVTNYISERDVSFLEVENYSVKYISYDWRLNE